MPELTKEQLLEKLAAVEAENETLRGQVQRLNASGEGWLITTLQPTFDGSVYGIQFINGQAFIRKDQRVPHFEVTPMKDSTITKYGYKPEEVAAIREREKIPSSQRAAEALRDDFGYQVEYFGADRLADIQNHIDNRVAQRSQAEMLLEAQRRAEGVVAPGYMGK